MKLQFCLMAALALAANQLTAAKEEDMSLDDLFEDTPAEKPTLKPAEARPAKPAPTYAPKPSMPKPSAATEPTARTRVTYEMEGPFVPNDKTKAMVKNINAVRTEIDSLLRKGGVICFGARYSRVTGDSKTTDKMYEVLPELLQRSTSYEQFRAGVRAAGLFYLHDDLCEDLYRNRIDYRKLKEYREKYRNQRAYEDALKRATSNPLF